MTALDRRVQIHSEVVSTDLGDGETALLHLESKIYFSLNATGTRVWHGLQQGLTPKEISQRLQAEFEVEPAQADRSVLELLSELADQKLVQIPDQEGVEP
jgi:hypothetical protein